MLSPQYLYAQYFLSLVNILNNYKYKAQSFGLFKSDKPFYLALYYISFLMIMQAGDLHPNPGPHTPKFPCVVCGKAAKWGQRCVCCDQCQGWYHTECMEMNTAIYQAIANSSNVSWICCQCGVPNFASSLFSSTDIELSNSYSSLLSPATESISSDVPNSPLAFSSPNVKKPKSRSKSKPTRNNLKIMAINFQGIRNKTAELGVCIQENNPDVILGTKTHLT